MGMFPLTSVDTRTGAGGEDLVLLKLMAQAFVRSTSLWVLAVNLQPHFSIFGEGEENLSQRFCANIGASGLITLESSI